MLSQQTIRSIGTEVRAEYSLIAGNCEDIARDLSARVEEHFEIPLHVQKVTIGEQRATHYVNKLAATHYSDSVSGPVLVDAALDQFCFENKHRDGVRGSFAPRSWLPAVAIYPPGAEERHVWYYRRNDPSEGYDVFTGEPLED